MDAPQLHLMLNHIPVVGTLIVVVALVAAKVFRSAALQKFGLAILLGAALIAIPVYFSGEPTEERIEEMAGVSETSLEAHESAANAPTLALVILGILALGGLVRERVRASRVYNGAMPVCTLALSLGMAWTAHLGGRIHHPEIRGESITQATVQDDQDD